MFEALNNKDVDEVKNIIENTKNKEEGLFRQEKTVKLYESLQQIMDDHSQKMNSNLKKS